MIETQIRNYLVDCNIENIGNNVFLMRPEDDKMPSNKTYLMVEKLTSEPSDLLFSTRFAIQSINPTSDYISALIDSEVVEKMLAFNADGIGVSLVSASIPYHSSQTKEYRYQSIFEIYHY